jgi:hypothetical protein
MKIRGHGSARSSIRATGHLVERMEHLEAMVSRRLHHQVGALRRPTDAQHRVTMRKHPLGDRMEDFVECGVPNPFGARQRNKWERDPFADYWYVTCQEEWQSEGFHGADIFRQLRGIVSGAGAVGTGDEDQQLSDLFIV